MTSLYKGFQIILEFLQPLNKQNYDQLEKSESVIAYLSDIFENPNEVKIKLQGKVNFINYKSIISTFISKLSLMWKNRENTYHGNYCANSHFTNIKLSTLKQSQVIN